MRPVILIVVICSTFIIMYKILYQFFFWFPFEMSTVYDLSYTLKFGSHTRKKNKNEMEKNRKTNYVFSIIFHPFYFYSIRICLCIKKYYKYDSAYPGTLYTFTTSIDHHRETTVIIL